MSKQSDNEDFVRRFQEEVGLKIDGWAGKNTNARLTELLDAYYAKPDPDWQKVIASSFADPADVETFKKCKASGRTDKECLKYGDNGKGKWGHITAQENIPYVALPWDVWEKAGKKGGDKVQLRLNGGSTYVAILGDTMPQSSKITNGSGIDLNPATLRLFGLKAPILKSGFEWKWGKSTDQVSEIIDKPVFDSRTEGNLATLIPEAEEAFRRWLAWAIPQIRGVYNLTLKVIGGSRTGAEQNALYAQGRTKPGKIVTNARAGQSNHNFGLACDMGLFDGSIYFDSAQPNASTSIYKSISDEAKNYGLYWGGDWASFTDPPHFQLGDLSVAEMRAKYPIYEG